MRLLSEIRSRLGNYHIKSGMFHFYRGEYNQAMEYLEKALASGQLVASDESMARSYLSAFARELMPLLREHWPSESENT